jgi:hypothetical protein
VIKLDGVEATTAKSLEEIKANIMASSGYVIPEVTDSYIWRENIKVALVGGGPSLKDTIKDIGEDKLIVACGSSHDFLIENGITPYFCVLCDSDDIVLEYLTKDSPNTCYLIASQCSPKVFGWMADNKKHAYIWHAGGGKELDYKIFGEDKAIIGGGCTVGTRALCLMIGMGYSNFHLYGFDSCLSKDFKHHAYEFKDETKETLGNISEIALGSEEGKKFYVSGYMLTQLFDFQKMLRYYADKIQVTIHGEGLLKHLMDLARQKIDVEGVSNHGN